MIRTIRPVIPVPRNSRKAKMHFRALSYYPFSCLARAEGVSPVSFLKTRLKYLASS